MKPLSETLTELGIAFTFPINIKDANGYETYFESSEGYWYKSERDSNGNETYCENGEDYWYKSERDSNGNVTYHEHSDDSWYKYERDSNGKETYYENSQGTKIGIPRSAKTCEGKVVEVDGIKYKLTAL